MRKWLVAHEAVLIVLAAVVFVRIPTLFEPYWYGDEGIYLTIGRAMRSGMELYREVHDNKPPLLYVVAAIASGREFWFKFILLLWNLATVGIFWNLALKWFKKMAPAVWSTVVFALLTSIPLIEGNVVNAELFFLLFTVGAMSIAYSEGNLVVAGTLLGLGGLFKTPALIEAAVWPLVWLFSKDRKWFSKSWRWGVGVAIPIVLATIYFGMRGTLPEFLTAAGVKLIPYVASWKVDLPIIGTLMGRAGVLAVWLLVSWLVRKQLSKNGLILAIWWGMGLFAALLSGRPYPHYLLQLVPVVSLALGMATWGTVLGKQSQQEYFRWFNPQVPVNYAISKKIMEGSTPDDKIFVWGDEPMIYAISKRLPAVRFTVKYHIKEFGAEKEVMDKLTSEPPRYIISFGKEEELPGLLGLFEEKYLVEEPGIYRRWKE
ncbi:MAG: hypothetical protein UU16_C0059G0009 [Candidatus Woesebacteria bacterium GW2011_GWA2_40_7]|uniref:Glycosyltransferase RgtA/B/C/D-like domain-containing protein n=1 Tax=Candidatus Woesebacteria bacterium GW2011_GWA2_40_7 TaxID=1618562 RepID=A0A0G0T3B9_9BACT|nr:MAG: hypothetical protein UU16_C0059G0009 [Candidatus Woesebacteria bacterium GW2011_GWA2_40_7]